ncbi:MAG: alanine racemase [Anaerolineales bacterium]|nr:alanine racemase [Anaerolineales bacterium]
MSSTWAEIDLSAIQHNLRRMKALAGVRVMAVVKANAYGHGAVEVSRAAALAGADWLGVARVEEGMALRQAGLALPILVMGYTPPAVSAEAIGHDLTLTVFDAESAQAYAATARALNRTARVHVKVDTGMGRLGVLPEDAPEFIGSVRRLEGLQVEGCYTHFANADMLDGPQPPPLSARAQLARFNAVLQALPLRPSLLHACNSAGALTIPEARLDLVRVGIALYGLNPSAEVPCPPDFRPALSWKARVTQVKLLPPGHGVSYGHEYITTEAETVAAVSVGYADGYRRAPRVNEVLIRGRRAPVRGRVCMDQIIVGVSHIPGVQPGDEVTLIGVQGEARLTADDLARKWGTINYEVTCGIAARVPRVFV